MPLDVLASVRSTAVIALVTASFSSPILVKSDAFANISGGGKSGHAEPTETLVAGGVEFAMPQSWGRLGAGAAAGASDEDRIGTVVSGICPGGSTGATCKDDVKVTFVAYSGDKGHELPELREFSEQLEAQLGTEFKGYKAGESGVKNTETGMAWLDHEFTWRSGTHDVHQRFAAYRHDDGSGVIAMISGAASADHTKALDAFLESGAAVSGAH